MNREFDTNNSVDLYRQVLSDSETRFPYGYWKQPGIENECRKIIKYLIEEVLKWNDEEIKSKLTLLVFKKYKLGGMMATVYDSSPYLAVNDAYPGRFKPWEVSTPKNYWNDERNRDYAIKWLLNKYQRKSVKELKTDDFIKNHLSGLWYHLSVNGMFKDIDIENQSSDSQTKGLVRFSNDGNNKYRVKETGRIDIPIRLLNEIGVTKENNNVQITVIDGKIIIERVN